MADNDELNEELSPTVDLETEIEVEPDIELEADMEIGGTASEYNAEAWAVGERHGVPVSSTDQTYHNNAKYYAESIEGDAEAAAASAASAAADAEAASHYGARYATTIPWDENDSRKISACSVTYDMTIDELLAMGGS